MLSLEELGTLFDGLRAAVTIADADYRIVFLNDLAIEHYASRGGEKLVGTSLLDCHSPASQAKIRRIYARHQAGDMTPTRYHEKKDGDRGESIVLIPLVVEGRFWGLAELLWPERDAWVFEG